MLKFECIRRWGLWTHTRPSEYICFFEPNHCCLSSNMCVLKVTTSNCPLCIIIHNCRDVSRFCWQLYSTWSEKAVCCLPYHLHTSPFPHAIHMLFFRRGRRPFLWRWFRVRSLVSAVGKTRMVRGSACLSPRCGGLASGLCLTLVVLHVSHTLVSLLSAAESSQLFPSHRGRVVRASHSLIAVLEQDITLFLTWQSARCSPYLLPWWDIRSFHPFAVVGQCTFPFIRRSGTASLCIHSPWWDSEPFHFFPVVG